MIKQLISKYGKIFTVFTLLGIAYFTIRLINLTIIPIFTDEAIYLRWAQIAWHDSAWRFISLTDGKQPLFIWLMIPFMKVVTDPLIAGRLASVVVGFLSMGMMGITAYELWGSKKTAVFAGILYLLSPFCLFYDRLALYDSLVALIAIICLYLEIKLAKTPRLDLALILGMAIGAGLLNKSSAQFAIFLLPFSPLVFDWKNKFWKKKFVRWLLMALIAVIMALIYYNILRLSPFFHIVNTKNELFVMSFAEFSRSPFGVVLGNLRALIDWVYTYLTFPIAFLLVLSIIYGLKFYKNKTLLVLTWFLFPFLTLSFFGRVIYPRFVLFMTVPLFLVMSVFLSFLYDLLEEKKKYFAILLAIVFVLPIYFIGNLLFKPSSAPLPSADKGQFVNDWPSGYGIKEVVEFLKNEAKDKKIYVGTEGTFGLMPFSLELYIVDNPNIEMKAFWPVGEIPKEVILKAREKPTYFIFNESQKIPPAWPIVKIAEYQKGDNKAQFLRLFKVKDNGEI